jgi:hypothetical protein
MRCYNAANYAANRESIIARTRKNQSKREALVRSYTTKEVERHGLEKQNTHLTVRAMSLLALSAARTAEARVTELMTHLGLNAPALPRDAGSVIVLVEDLLRPTQYVLTVSPNYLRYWGGVFFGLDQLYLESVGILLENDEPWKVFCDFANRLTYSLHTEGSEALKRSEELQLAAKYLAAAKGHLWHVAYLFCRRVYNGRTADAIFGGRPTAVSELHTLLLR